MAWASKGLFLVLIAPSLFATKPDTEIWQQTLARFEIKQDVSWTTKAGFRWRKDATKLYHEYGETGILIRKPCEWDLFPSFRLSIFNIERKHLVDFNPRLTFHKYWWLDQIRLVNRSRFEYSSLANRGIYRNRQDVQVFAAPTERSLGFYVSEELFFSTRPFFYEFRIHSGFLIPYSERFNIDAGYLFRLLKLKGEWRRANILTFYFNFLF